MEPMIVINGVTLSDAQAMSLRVAVGSLMQDMQDPTALGDDEHGRFMVGAYRLRMQQIEGLMLRHLAQSAKPRAALTTQLSEGSAKLQPTQVKTQSSALSRVVSGPAAQSSANPSTAASTSSRTSHRVATSATATAHLCSTVSVI